MIKIDPIKYRFHLALDRQNPILVVHIMKDGDSVFHYFFEE